MATLKFVGANRTVTGSKYLLSTDAIEVLFDCGMYQGLKELRLRNWAPPPFDVRKLGAVVISHAHIDHTGYLPAIVKNGFRGPIYATSGTCDLLGLLLPDTARLMMEEAEYANRAGYSKHTPALPLFNTDDAAVALKLLHPVKYGERVELASDLAFTYQIAGHILGSAVTRFQIGDTKLTFTGDLGRYGQPVIKDPDPLDETDILVTESTYGDRIHPPNHVEQLTAALNEVGRSGGALVIPAFAVGRTQELIYMIRALENSGAVPALPVHIDSPMAVDATAIYLRHHEDHNLAMTQLENEHQNPLRTRNFSLDRTPQQSKALNGVKGPVTIISASGMAAGGRVMHHLKMRLPLADTIVLLVGYQAEGTRGRALQNGATSMWLFGQEVPVRATVMTIDGLSAHADQAEMMRWLSGFKRAPRDVYICHGEDKGAFGLKQKIESDLKWRCTVPDFGTEVSL